MDSLRDLSAFCISLSVQCYFADKTYVLLLDKYRCESTAIEHLNFGSVSLTDNITKYFNMLQRNMYIHIRMCLHKKDIYMDVRNFV